jgi:2-polyprenyl-3-methyl-5-hydroxy-6-metoxy-1,4-benzoquinol methylase
MTTEQVIIEEDAHWWFRGRTRALNSLMRQYLPPQPDGVKLLDVGCGAGNMIHHLSHYGQVQGLEIDERPVKKARERGTTSNSLM